MALLLRSYHQYPANLYEAEKTRLFFHPVITDFRYKPIGFDTTPRFQGKKYKSAQDIPFMGGFCSTLLAFNMMIRFALCTNLTDIQNRIRNEELNLRLHSTVYNCNPDSSATIICGGTTGRKYCCEFYYDGCTEYTHKVSTNQEGIIVERPSIEGNSDDSKTCCDCCYNTANVIVNLLHKIANNVHESNDGTYFVVIGHPDSRLNYILCSNNADEFTLASIETGEDGKYSFSPAKSVKINAWAGFIQNSFTIKSVPIAELFMISEGTASLKILKTEELIAVEQIFKFGSDKSTPKQDEADTYEDNMEVSTPSG